MTVEGMTGWTNRTVTESRLGIRIADLDTSMRFAREPQLRVMDIGKKAVPGLGAENFKPEESEQLRIDRVTIQGRQFSDWQEMVKALSHAPPGAAVDLDLAGTNNFSRTVKTTLKEPSLPVRALAWGVSFLPEDNTPHNKVVALSEIVCFFIFLCIIGSIFRYYQQFLGMTVANRVVMDLRRRVYDHAVQLPSSYFARKGTSDIMSRLTQDAATLTDGVNMAFGKAVQEPVKAMGAFTGAMLINWQLTLLIVGSVPILALIIRKFSKHMRKASRRALENSSSILGIINETFIGVRVVKAYSAEGYERRRFSLANKKLLRQQRKLNHYNALSRPTIETLAVIVSSIPMLFAANWIFSKQESPQNILVLLAMFGAMLEPMRKLADVNSKVQQTNAAATRVFEILDMQIEPNTSHDLPKLPTHRKSIEFRNVVFSYPGHDEIVLNNVNALVKAGQNVAVVGGNGSGKTTLLQLLPRLYVPTSGQVLIDDVDTATVSLRSLRKQIGLVTQDTLLFADTIYNNIAYGTRHATREQVLDASRRAFADEFITTLPEGYETRVGEHGVRLSGGQKQRIAIARAILRDPTILILDEAMSQIDADSETKITDALRAFTRNRTTLMIAHRFQSVISADMIICLDKGNVAGIGTHSQLLENCLAYRRLYENQFREAG
jgi:ABC-type multidrug transport system fused ATPase/permease subunit